MLLSKEKCAKFSWQDEKIAPYEVRNGFQTIRASALEISLSG